MGEVALGEVGAIVLAAGLATRFRAGVDDSKVTAALDGTPLVAHVVSTALASRARPILVVTGQAASRVAAAVPRSGDIGVIFNPDYAAGLASSLKAGVTALPPGLAGVLILLGDMPLVSARTLDGLLDRFACERPDAVVPVYEGRWGNPILLARSLFPDVKALSGDRGARRLLDQPGRRVAAHAVDDPHVLTDIDTPEGLTAVAHLRRGQPI